MKRSSGPFWIETSVEAELPEAALWKIEAIAKIDQDLPNFGGLVLGFIEADFYK